MSQVERPILFATHEYEYFSKTLSAGGFYDVGVIERRSFPDQEHYIRIHTRVEKRNVVLVSGTSSDRSSLELYDLACALVRYGARTLTLVIPFYGYSTMERAVKEGEVVTAKTRARLFSAIPIAEGGNRVLLVDLHSEGIPHYFEGAIRPVHMYARPVVKKLIGQFGANDYVLASTDAGRAKWVESLANELGVAPAFVYKKRIEGGITRVTGISAHVKDKTVVIYDDMIRTGGSLLQAAQAYRDAGAKEIFAVATHGVFPMGALERIQQTGLLTQVACTDSHPNSIRYSSNEFLKVDSLAPLITDYIRDYVCR